MYQLSQYLLFKNYSISIELSWHSCQGLEEWGPGSLLKGGTDAPFPSGEKEGRNLPEDKGRVGRE